MGYTHYWRQKRAFTMPEWERITSEAKRICAKAQRGLYSGKEDFASATELNVDDRGVRSFKEDGAYRIFPHPEIATPMQGASIALAGPSGEADTTPIFDAKMIALNGQAPKEYYESFVLQRNPVCPDYQKEEAKAEGIFNCCKTEYRPYDAVVVSILAAAALIAPEAITVSSDGGQEAIKLMF